MPAASTIMRSRRLPAAALGAFVLLAWGWAVIAPKADILKPHRKHRTDFTVYTAAAHAIMAGQDPYVAHNLRGWHYLYPPMTAILMSPLACVGPRDASFAWFTLSVAMWLGSGWMLSRVCRGLTPAPAGTAVWLGMLFVFLPVMHTLSRGQVNLATLLMICVMLYALRIGRDFWAGFALAVASCIKVMPLLIAPVLGWMWLRHCWQHRTSWRTCLWSGRVFAGLAAGLTSCLLVLPATVMGPNAALKTFQRWQECVGTGYFSANEQGDVFGNLLHINDFSDRNQSWYRFAGMAAGGFDYKTVYKRQTVPRVWQYRLRWILGVWFAGQIALACLLAPGRWDDRADIRFYVAPAAMAIMSAVMGKVAWMHGLVVAMPLVTIAAGLVPTTPRSTRTLTQHVLQVTWVAVLIAWLATYTFQSSLGRANVMTWSIYVLIVVTWIAAVRDRTAEAGYGTTP